MALSVARSNTRNDLGLRGTWMGWILGLGPGRERRRPAMVHGDSVSAFGDGAGAAQHVACLERYVSNSHLSPHHRCNIHDAKRVGSIGARFWRGSAADGVIYHLHGCDRSF